MKEVLSKISIIVAVVIMTGVMMSTAVNAENKTSDANSIVADTAINLNTATVKELSGLSGIGKKKAEAIIAYRNNVGNFSDISDLKKVEGIGRKTFERIKNQIAVN